MNRKEKVYAFVKDKIIHNQFKAGQVISENQLTHLTGVSRTPVREALNQLEQDYLIKRVGRETVVTDLTEQDVEEIYELRAMLETYALSKTINYLPEEKLDQIADRFKRAAASKNWDQYLQVDIAFHKLITTLHHHQRTKMFLQELQGQVDRTRYINENNHHRMQHSLTEHLEIIKMIKRRNLPAAENALKFHLQEVYLSVKKYLRLRQ